MEPTPVPRTPLSQRIATAASEDSKEEEAAAPGGAIVLAQPDCVDTWSTDKIEPFAPAAAAARFSTPVTAAQYRGSNSRKMAGGSAALADRS